MIGRLPPAALGVLLFVSPLAAEPLRAFACRGHEPSWSLRIEGSSATLTQLGQAPRVLEGRLLESGGGRLPFFVYRAKDDAAGDLVALITTEACRDTMADAAEGGGIFAHTARLSLASGEVWEGCCSALAAATRGASAAPATPAPPPAPAPAAPVVSGEITALALPDGTVCRSAGKGATIAFGGRRAEFTCGTREGARVVLIGGLDPVEGGCRATRARIVQGESGFTLAGEEPALVVLPR